METKEVKRRSSKRSLLGLIKVATEEAFWKILAGGESLDMAVFKHIYAFDCGTTKWPIYRLNC
jgi:hypothetical protein